MSRIDSLEALRKALDLKPEELAWREDESTVPLAITDHFFSLIDRTDPSDPLRRQVVPTSAENNSEEFEDIDPLEEVSHSVNPRLVHRYRNRVAFLVTDVCPMYCRHCFRRRFTGNLQKNASDAEIQESADYVNRHPEVKEILLTGGDVLTLSNAALSRLIGAFREKRPDLMIRLCTRYLTSDPSRIDDALISMLSSYGTSPIFIMTQFNHSRELCPETVRAIAKFSEHGFPLFNQTVLLKGVNDNPQVLADLCENLLSCKVKPYYLFEGDLVSGTSHFRVPLEQAIEIYKELSILVSGLALPTFAIDLPKGKGKVTVGTIDLTKKDDGALVITTPEGVSCCYPSK